MTRWAALLRGVNLSKRTLRSADLKAFLEAQRCTEVRTLIASGNAVLTSPEVDGPALERRLDDAAEAAFGFRTDFVLRGAAELDALIAACPFPEAAAERGSQLLVLFCREPVNAEVPARLAALHDGPERVAAHQRELVIDYAGRMSDSKIDKPMNKVGLPRVMTGRNWNTVVKIRAAL